MTLPSSHNYFEMASRETIRQNPDLFGTAESLVEAARKASVAAQALHTLNDASKPTDLRKTYNDLRKQLYDLQQQAKHTEIFCNNKAGDVKHFEERIAILLRDKKKADEAGELGHARMLEHQIVNLETEVLDAKKEFDRAKKQSTYATRALKAFTGHEAIAELKKQLAL
jgi:hypothetical protein